MIEINKFNQRIGNEVPMEKILKKMKTKFLVVLLFALCGGLQTKVRQKLCAVFPTETSVLLYDLNKLKIRQ